MEEPIVYSVPDIARLLSISRSQAYALVNEGKIPSVRLGGVIRVPRDKFEEWLAGETTGGKQ